MTIYNIKDLNKLKDQIFTFDTNVFINLYCYNLYRNNQVEYISNFLIKKQSKFYVDNTVINEFINIYIKKYLKIDKFEKKEHRNTDNYITCLKNLKLILNNIKDSYNIIDYKSVNIFYNLQNLENYENIFTKMEFTDYTIKETTKINNAILITNDNDFNDCDINILKI